MTLEQLQSLGISPASVDTAFVPDSGPGSLLSQVLNSKSSDSDGTPTITPGVITLLNAAGDRAQGSQQDDAQAPSPGALALLKAAAASNQGADAGGNQTLPPGAIELIRNLQGNQGSQQDDAQAPSPEALALLKAAAASNQGSTDDVPTLSPESLALIKAKASDGGAPIASNNSILQGVLQGSGSPQPQVVVGPDGKPMVLPPNTGAANTYGGGGSPAVQVHVYGGSSATPTPNVEASTSSGSPAGNSFPDFYTWASQFGYQKGQQIHQAEKIAMQKLYAEAQSRHKDVAQPQLIQTPDGPSYIRLGNTMMPVPSQKGVATAEKTLPDGRIMRYVTDSSRPDYLAGQVVYDRNTGQPMITGEPDPTLQLQRMSDQSKLSDIKSQAAELAAKIASGQKAPWYSSTSYENQLAGLKAKYDQLQGSGVSLPDPSSSPSAPLSASGSPGDAFSIRAAYKAGQIDKPTAAAMLRRLQIPSIQ